MYTAYLQVGPHENASRLFHNIHWHYVLLCTLPCSSCCSVLPTHKIIWHSCLLLGFYKGKASHTLTSKSNGVWSSSSSPKNSLLVLCSTPRRPQDSHSYGSYHLRNKMSVCVDNPSNHKESSSMVKDKGSLQEEGEDSSPQVSKSFFTADLTQGSMLAEDLTSFLPPGSLVTGGISALLMMGNCCEAKIAHISKAQLPPWNQTLRSAYSKYAGEQNSELCLWGMKGDIKPQWSCS